MLQKPVDVAVEHQNADLVTFFRLLQLNQGAARARAPGLRPARSGAERRGRPRAGGGRRGRQR